MCFFREVRLCEATSNEQTVNILQLPSELIQIILGYVYQESGGFQAFYAQRLVCGFFGANVSAVLQREMQVFIREVLEREGLWTDYHTKSGQKEYTDHMRDLKDTCRLILKYQTLPPGAQEKIKEVPEVLYMGSLPDKATANQSPLLLKKVSLAAISTNNLTLFRWLLNKNKLDHEAMDQAFMKASEKGYSDLVTDILDHPETPQCFSRLNLVKALEHTYQNGHEDTMESILNNQRVIYLLQMEALD